MTHGYSSQVLVQTRSLVPSSPGALGVRAQGREWSLMLVFTDHMWAAVQQATLPARPWQSRPCPAVPEPVPIPDSSHLSLRLSLGLQVEVHGL